MQAQSRKNCNRLAGGGLREDGGGEGRERAVGEDGDGQVQAAEEGVEEVGTGISGEGVEPDFPYSEEKVVSFLRIRS